MIMTEFPNIIEYNPMSASRLLLTLYGFLKMACRADNDGGDSKSNEQKHHVSSSVWGFIISKASPRNACCQTQPPLLRDFFLRPQFTAALRKWLLEILMTEAIVNSTNKSAMSSPLSEDFIFSKASPRSAWFETHGMYSNDFFSVLPTRFRFSK